MLLINLIILITVTTAPEVRNYEDYDNERNFSNKNYHNNNNSCITGGFPKGIASRLPHRFVRLVSTLCPRFNGSGLLWYWLIP